MSIPKTIKQIMPIPDDYIILTKVVDEVGNTHMLNFSPMGYRYMYALIDCHGGRSDEVDVYVIRPDGRGYVDDSGITLVVPKYKCPHCGSIMKPQVDDGDMNYFCTSCNEIQRVKDVRTGGIANVHQSFHR